MRIKFLFIHKIIITEARERSVKAISFAKLLRKDLEVAAEFSFSQNTEAVLNRLHLTGHVQVRFLLNIHRSKVDLVRIQKLYGTDCIYRVTFRSGSFSITIVVDTFSSNTEAALNRLHLSGHL